MPFLAPLVPALIGGAASAAGGAVVNSLVGTGGQKGSGFQAQGLNPEQLQQQQSLVDALKAQGGLQNQSNVFNQEQGLANQLQDMAQGGGPNPALAQLAQTTGQNTAQQAALMAGQRGVGANAGLIARQAAQQGAALQQQATGQAATLRAQQQLASIGALQQQQGMLGNLATQQAGQQIGATQGLGNMQLGNLQQQNAANVDIAGQNADAQNQILGGAVSGISGALGTAAQGAVRNAMKPSINQEELSNGAAMQQAMHLAEGGQVGMPAIMKENYKGAKSKVGRLLMAQGGKVHDMKSGGHVPGKAKVPGAVDSYKNDTVDAILSPGEIVLPRSVTQSADPITGAAKFVAAIKAKKGKK